MSEQKIWKISPGSGGSGWEDCLTKGIIGIGWEYKKDLHDLSEEKVMEYIKEKYKGKAANQFIDFIFNIKKDDIVIAYAGPSKIYGIGIVEKSDWIFNDDANKAWLANTRKIRWDEKISNIKVHDKNIISILGYNQTLFDVEKDFFIKRILPLLPKESDVRNFFNNPKNSRELPILNILDKKSQIILYGPPGTGKTYKAREYSVNFIQKNHLGGVKID